MYLRTVERFQTGETAEFQSYLVDFTLLKISEKGGNLDRALIMPKLNIHLFTCDGEGSSRL